MPDGTCLIAGCDLKIKARGWCANHYRQWKVYGDPLAPGKRARRGSCIAKGGRKYCSACRETKPVDEFYIERKSPDGRTSRCIECAKAYKKSHYAKNAESVKAKARAYNLVNTERVKAKKRAKYHANRIEILAKMREHYRENSDRIRARSLAYYEANKEAHRERDRRWREANPEREKLRSTNGNRRRRARKAENQYVRYTADQLLARLAYYGHRCYLCGEDGTEIDHVKPVTKGGPEMLANLRPICRECNMAKYNHWPIPPQLFRKIAFANEPSLLSLRDILTIGSSSADGSPIASSV